MKALLKDLFLHIIYYSNLYRIIRWRQKNTLTILLYHGVAPKIIDGIFNYRKKFLQPENFDKQMEYLSRYYNVIDLDDVITLLKTGDTLPPYSMAITFDDGYKNNLEHASPILENYHLPATIFLATNFIDKKVPLWVDRLEYVIGHGIKYQNMTFAEKISFDDNTRSKLKKVTSQVREELLSELEKENNISLTNDANYLYSPCTWENIINHQYKRLNFGAHTINHPILRHISREEAKNEISGSLAKLKDKNILTSSIFAYPNGQRDDFDKTIESFVKDESCAGALTTIPGQNTSHTNPYALKRYTMDGTDSMISFIITVTGTLDWFRKLYRS